jgi:pantothenate kinase
MKAKRDSKVFFKRHLLSFSPAVTYLDSMVFLPLWGFCFLLFAGYPQMDIRLSFLINSTIGVIFWHEYFHFLPAAIISLFIKIKEKKGGPLFVLSKKDIPQTVSSLFQILAITYFFLFPAGLLFGFLPLTLEAHWTFFLTPPGLMFCEFIIGTALARRKETGDALGIRIIKRIKSLGVNVPKEVFFKGYWVRAVITSCGYMGSLAIGLIGMENPLGIFDSFYQPEYFLPSFPPVVFAVSALHVTLGLSTLLLGLIPLPAFRFQDGAVLVEKLKRKEVALNVGNTPEEIAEAGVLIRRMRSIHSLFDDMEYFEDEPERAEKTEESILDEFAKFRGEILLSKYDPQKTLEKALDKFSQKEEVTDKMVKKISDLFDDMERRMRTAHPELMDLVRPHPNNPWARDIQWDGLRKHPDRAREVLIALDKTLATGSEEEARKTVAAIPGLMKLAVSEVPEDILSNSLTILENILNKGPGGQDFMKVIFSAFYNAAGYAVKLEVDMPSYLKRGMAVKIGLLKDAGDLSPNNFDDAGETLFHWAFPNQEQEEMESGEGGGSGEEFSNAELTALPVVPYPEQTFDERPVQLQTDGQPFSRTPGKAIVTGEDFIPEDSLLERVMETFSFKKKPLNEQEAVEVEEVWLPLAEALFILRDKFRKERFVVALGGVPGRRQARSTEIFFSLLAQLGKNFGTEPALIRMAEFSLTRTQLDMKNISPGSPEAFQVKPLLRCIATLKEGHPAKTPQWQYSENPEEEGPLVLSGNEREVSPGGIILVEGSYVLKRDDIKNPVLPDTDLKAYHLLSSLVDFSLFIARPMYDRFSRTEIQPTLKNADLVLEEGESRSIDSLMIPKIGKRFKAKGFQWEGYLESSAKWKISGDATAA